MCLIVCVTKKKGGFTFYPLYIFFWYGTIFQYQSMVMFTDFLQSKSVKKVYSKSFFNLKSNFSSESKVGNGCVSEKEVEVMRGSANAN